jgi:hypothetical protein
MWRAHGRSDRLAALAVLIGVLFLFWAPAGADSTGTAGPGDVKGVCPEPQSAAPASGVGTSMVPGAPAAETVCSDVFDEVISLVDPASGGRSSEGTCGDSCAPASDNGCRSSSEASYGGSCRDHSDGEYDRPPRDQTPDRECAETCSGPPADDCRRSPGGDCGGPPRGRSAPECPPASSGAGDGSCLSERPPPGDCRTPCSECRPRPDQPCRAQCPAPRGCPGDRGPDGCPCSEATPPSPPPRDSAPPDARPPAPSQPPPGPPPSNPGSDTATPPAAPAPPPPGRPASEAASSAAGTPGPKVSEQPIPPGDQVAGRESSAGTGNRSTAPLPRTGSQSRPLALVGVAWILGGIGIMLTARSRRLSQLP